MKDIEMTQKEVEMVAYLISYGRKMKGGEITIRYHNREPDKIIRPFEEIKLGQKAKNN